MPANKGRRYRAEVLSRAEASALIAVCSPSSSTGIRNRALITLLYRGGLQISAECSAASGPSPTPIPRKLPATFWHQDPGRCREIGQLMPAGRRMIFARTSAATSFPVSPRKPAT